MGKIISFANQKGGVGKTTSAINIAASLGLLGKTVLLCDMDPQANTTSGVGIQPKSQRYSVYNVIIENRPVSEVMVETAYKNLFLLPSSINLAGGEIELIENIMEDEDNSQKFFKLKAALDEVRDEYDYILVDCPPSLGILTLNALSASDFLIVPMQCEYFALEGLSQLTQTVKHVKRLYNPNLELGGILVTMYDGRLNLSLQIMDELKKFFPDKILKTPIPRTVRLSEAPSHGMPVYYYDKTSKGTDCYSEAAKEIMELAWES